MPKANLLGQRFGKLTIIKEIPTEERPPKTAKRGVHWLCQCDCGKEVVHYSGALLQGDINSCGCARGEALKRDITGQHFGKVHVIMPAPYEKGKEKPKYFCECDCGNVFIVPGASLRSGHTQSCGCLNKTIFPGMRFGKLTTIEKTGRKNSDSKYYWLCQCDCGAITEVLSSNLTKGNTQSCGCVRSRGEEAIAEFLTKHNINHRREYTFEDLRKIRPLRFDFAIFTKDNTLDCLIEFQGLQHYTNKDFGKNCRETDIMKKEYCDQNNIPLYEIKYNEPIEEKLIEIFKSRLKEVEPHAEM